MLIRKKKEKEINKNNALKILRLNYLNSIDNQNLILKNEMNKIEKLIYKQKKNFIKKKQFKLFYKSSNNFSFNKQFLR